MKELIRVRNSCHICQIFKCVTFRGGEREEERKTGQRSIERQRKGKEGVHRDNDRKGAGLEDIHRALGYTEQSLEGSEAEAFSCVPFICTRK